MTWTIVLNSCALLALLALTQCSSDDAGSKKSEKSEFGPTYKERMAAADRALFNSDFSQRSSFEKKSPTMKTDKAFRTDKYNPKAFTQTKAFYSGKDEVKEKDFAQSDKKSNIGNKEFSGSDKESKLADETFNTKDSRFSGQENRFSGKASRMGDDVYSTRAEPDAKKAMEKSERPYIRESRNPSYSEAEVRSLLNKQ